MKKQFLFWLFLVVFGGYADAQHPPATLPSVNSLGPAKTAPKQSASQAPAPKRTARPVPRNPAPKWVAGKTIGSPGHTKTAQPPKNKPSSGLVKTTKSAGATVASRRVRGNR